VASILAVLVVLASVGLGVLNEPFRRYAEQQMNQHLNGYTVSIGALHLRPISGTISFEQVVVRQVAGPDPPSPSFPNGTPPFIGKHSSMAGSSVIMSLLGRRCRPRWPT
jgi:hypothetical protein